MTPDQQKEFFKKNFTLQGRIFHPHLLVPSARNPGDVPKFSVMFAWLKTSNLEVMQQVHAFIQQAFQACHPGINQQVLINPIKDFDTYMRQDGRPNPAYVSGHCWVNGSSGANFPPVVVGQDRQPVINEADVYSGRNAVVNISFYNMSGATGGKRGIGINVNAVMLLEGGTKEGGAGSVDVNQIFGGFQADMGLIQQGGQAPAPGAVAQANPYAQPAPAQAPAQQQYAQPQQPVQQPVQQPAQPEQQQQGANPFAPNPNTYV